MWIAIVRVLLWVLAAIAIIAPNVFWMYLSAIACAYVTHSGGCDGGLSDFWNDEFLEFALLPWTIGIALIWAARRLGRAKDQT